MNEYRKQQLAAAALIEQGATAEQVAAVFGWTKPKPTQPEREAPERSGTTGHKPRRKRKSKLLRILCRLLK